MAAPSASSKTATPIPAGHTTCVGSAATRFTLDHSRPPISPAQVALVHRLLTERISHRGICRVVGISCTWFQHHLQAPVKSMPQRIKPAERCLQKGEHSSTSVAGVRRVMRLCAAQDEATLDLARRGPIDPQDRRLFHRSTRRRACLRSLAKLPAPYLEARCHTDTLTV